MESSPDNARKSNGTQKIKFCRKHGEIETLSSCNDPENSCNPTIIESEILITSSVAGVRPFFPTLRGSNQDVYSILPDVRECE